MAEKKRKQSRAANRSGKSARGEGNGTGASPVIDHIEGLEDFEDETGDEITLKNLPVGSDSLLFQYLQRENLVDQEYFVTLYKYDRDHGEMKTYCERWVGQIPNEDQIGRAYGGGRYVLILQVVDGDGKTRGTTRKFHLHTRYDKISSNLKGPDSGSFPMISLGTGSEGNGGNQLQDAVNLVRVMMGTFLPLLKLMNPQQQQQQPVPPMSENVSSMMSENYKAFNEVMKETLLDNSQLYNDLARKNNDLPETTEDENESTGVVGMLNSILPLVEQFLPLITQKGQAGQAAVQTVKKLPAFQNAVKDKKTIKRLYEFISEKHSPEVAQKILKKFKISSPYKNTVKKEEEKPANKN